MQFLKLINYKNKFAKFSLNYSNKPSLSLFNSSIRQLTKFQINHSPITHIKHIPQFIKLKDYIKYIKKFILKNLYKKTKKFK